MLELSSTLKYDGFSLCDAEPSDFETYYSISRKCYEKYVNEFFGDWVEERQIKMNKDSFDNEIKQTLFKKILLNNSVVGFLACDIKDDKIDGVMIQMLECARNKGIGSLYMNYVTSIANQKNKPVFLQVFISNPAQNLYKRFGFVIYDKTVSHYLMKYDRDSFSYTL